jgi:hypothetical protein
VDEREERGRRTEDGLTGVVYDPASVRDIPSVAKGQVGIIEEIARSVGQSNRKNREDHDAELDKMRAPADRLIAQVGPEHFYPHHGGACLCHENFKTRTV